MIPKDDISFLFSDDVLCDTVIWCETPYERNRVLDLLIDRYELHLLADEVRLMSLDDYTTVYIRNDERLEGHNHCLQLFSKAQKYTGHTKLVSSRYGALFTDPIDLIEEDLIKLENKFK